MNLMLYIASILDPRKKLAYVEFTLHDMYSVEQALLMFSLVRKAMDEVFQCYKNMLQPQPQCHVDMVAIISSGKALITTMERLGAFKRHWLNSGLEEQQLELKKYLSEPLDDDASEDTDFDVLMWWKLNQYRFPIFAAIARDVLVVPISTIASKSAFSTSGHVLDAYRSSLTPKIVQALICAQDWLYGKPRGDPEQLEDDLDELDKLYFDLTKITLEAIREIEEHVLKICCIGVRGLSLRGPSNLCFEF
ncbi:HAT [Theobroma cacao]|nr:HAT [Theobroma cacao]